MTRQRTKMKLAHDNNQTKTLVLVRTLMKVLTSAQLLMKKGDELMDSVYEALDECGHEDVDPDKENVGDKVEIAR